MAYVVEITNVCSRKMEIANAAKTLCSIWIRNNTGGVETSDWQKGAVIFSNVQCSWTPEGRFIVTAVN